MCSYALKTQLKTGHFEVCCYGIDLGASIVRLNQSEHSIWRISTNESGALLQSLSEPELDNQEFV